VGLMCDVAVKAGFGVPCNDSPLAVEVAEGKVERDTLSLHETSIMLKRTMIEPTPWNIGAARGSIKGCPFLMSGSPILENPHPINLG